MIGVKLNVAEGWADRLAVFVAVWPTERVSFCGGASAPDRTVVVSTAPVTSTGAVAVNASPTLGISALGVEIPSAFNVLGALQPDATNATRIVNIVVTIFDGKLWHLPLCQRYRTIRSRLCADNAMGLSSVVK